MIVDNPVSKVEMAMSAPPATIAGLTLAGVGLQDWVLIVTLIWLGLQTGWFIYQRVQEFKKPKQ